MEAQGASGAVGNEVRITAEEARKLSALNADALVAYAMKMIREAVKECADWVTLQCGPWQRGQQLTPEHEKAVEVLRGLGYEVEVPHIYFQHSAVRIIWRSFVAQSQGDKP